MRSINETENSIWMDRCFTLRGLQNEIHYDAVKHGLFENKGGVDGYCNWLMQECREVRLSEVEHVAEEMADVIILTLSYGVHLGLDIAQAIKDKVEFNKTRPYQHGKRF